jgi:Zn-dependent metalloprotease
VRIDSAHAAGQQGSYAPNAVASGSSQQPPAGAHEIPVEVWVPDADGGIDHLAQKTGSAPSDDVDVRVAYETGRKVLEYVRREYGRDSFDGKGSVLKLRVHAPDPTTGEQHANNAFWFNDERRIWLGDGDGDYFSPLGAAEDVVAHEFFHGVIDSEIKLSYLGQEGALHESFADILATGIDGNWQIGEKVFTPNVPGDALRDISNLTYRDWRTFPAGEDEVHAMSEVPSQAAFLIGSTLGAKELRHLWYVALTDHLRNNAGFAGARDATIAAARVLYGAKDPRTQAVLDAWAAVGIDATTPKEPLPTLAPSNAAFAATIVQPLQLCF